MLDFYVRLRRGWGELGEVGGRNGGCDWMGFAQMCGGVVISKEEVQDAVSNVKRGS